MSLQKSLNRKFKDKEFRYETSHGGIVKGVVECVFIGTGLELDSDFKQYDIIVRSTNKNIYEFERCWFK